MGSRVMTSTHERQENGPCTYNNGEPPGKPSHNPHSFNEYANMLYIDQPISVGFSYGTNTVDSTTSASVLVWKLLQAFKANFPEYKSRDFGIFTESYGGHYGPGFTKYIMGQNSKIRAGTLSGTSINLVALGLNNAWINPYDNYKGMIDFGLNNTYKKLLTPAQATQYQNALDNRCLPQLRTCWSSGTNSACSRAVQTCKFAVEEPIARAGNFDVYDIRKPKSNKWPPQTYEKWLQQPDVQQQLGARQRFSECPSAPLRKFLQTGDGECGLQRDASPEALANGRTDSRNYLPTLNEIVKANITVLVWAGDADWICNWMANLYTANDIDYPGKSKFKSKPLLPYKVKGKEKGTFKTEGNLSFLRVYGAGHTVMAFRKSFRPRP
jgi:carboxypeptidase C (cathepsin A)